MIIDFRFLGQNGGSQGGGVTSGDVQSIVESYNYVNSGQVETQIESKGYITSADTQDFLTSADTENFLTSADTQNFLTSADTQNFLTSADTQGFVSATDYEEDAEVISTALNDLNERMSNIPSGSTHNAPIFVDSADTSNKADDIWDAIMNEGYIPDAWLTISIAGDLTHIKLNAYESSMVDGEIDLYFQWGNTMYKWTLLYDNQTGHAAFDSFTSNQFGVNTDGNILGVRKVAQAAYNELVASGETDETTAYYVVPDEPTPSVFDAETYCTGDLNGSWDGETCEFSWSDPNEGGSPRTEYYDANLLERKWECEQRGHNWDYDNQVCIDPSCEGDPECECESRGGAWVEDGESEGNGYCDECGGPGSTNEEIAAYNECNCLRNGGTWIPNPNDSEGGECQYPDEGGEA